MIRKAEHFMVLRNRQTLQKSGYDCLRFQFSYYSVVTYRFDLHIFGSAGSPCFPTTTPKPSGNKISPLVLTSRTHVGVTCVEAAKFSHFSVPSSRILKYLITEERVLGEKVSASVA